jgi:hypothetical protein
MELRLLMMLSDCAERIVCLISCLRQTRCCDVAEPIGERYDPARGLVLDKQSREAAPATAGEGPPEKRRRDQFVQLVGPPKGQSDNL